MKYCLLLFMALYFTACKTNQSLVYTVTTEPDVTLSMPPSKVLVLNTFEVEQYNYRKNKEELAARVGDTLIKNIAYRIKESAGLAVEPVYGITPMKRVKDSALTALLQQHGASHAIVINKVDVYFDQTAVQVTKSEKGKSREAFYDICSLIEYGLYDSNGRIEEATIRHIKQHSSRMVVSGLLAAGPSLSANSKAFYHLTNENKDIFLNKYFQGAAYRKRVVYTQTPFHTVGTALKQQNYQQALNESLRLTDNGNKEIKAKALYNCAVFSERNNDMASARRFLQQSIRAQRLPEAMAMQYSLRTN